MYRFAIVVAVIAGILIPTASAHASVPGYPKEQRVAEKRALNFAKEKYSIIGIIATCEHAKKNWKCDWAGMVMINDEYEPVHGQLLLTKNSYKVLKGMRWG